MSLTSSIRRNPGRDSPPSTVDCQRIQVSALGKVHHVSPKVGIAFLYVSGTEVWKDGERCRVEGEDNLCSLEE